MYIGKTIYLSEKQSMKLGVAFFVLWFASIIGWAANVIQTLYMLTSLERIADISGFGVLQVVGIFAAPLGAVLGWYGMF
jgi:hypothetical protein